MHVLSQWCLFYNCFHTSEKKNVFLYNIALIYNILSVIDALNKVEQLKDLGSLAEFQNVY